MGFSLIKQTFAKLLPRTGTCLGTGKNMFTADVESRWLNWQLQLNQHCTETQTGLADPEVNSFWDNQERLLRGGAIHAEAAGRVRAI